MEIFRREKKSEWKNVIKNLRNSKICDQERLDSISNVLKEGRTLFESDRVYLEGKIKELEELKKSTSFESSSVGIIDKNTEKYLKMIKRLNQKEIGDYARLESISNYLNDGMSILAEDEEYIKEKHQQLENKQTWRRNAQPQTILIDDFEVKPTHNFDSLSKTISGIIKNSNPHFTIGIYGEWGTGKTTLMRATERNLIEDGVAKKEQKILTVWFNAWKYEREENLAALSLMKTVAYAMEDHEKFDSLSKTIFHGLTIFGKDLIQQLALKIISKESNDLEEELDRKMDYMNKLYKDSVYFNGLDKIREQMQSIRESEGKDYRVVIFIDDLDRCSSSKALEVLESIKLFLDIEGFAFVIGLNHKTVTQLITHAYETTGVKGEDYIKKIIQIPIKIPSWSDENLVNLIENRIAKNLNEEYTQFLRQNSVMVSKVVDYNPRQLKRFINNVIIAFETFASNENSPQIKFDEIFLVKILKKEWPDFYSEFIKSKDFREIIQWLITQPKNLRKYFKYLNATTEDLPIEQKNKRIELLNKLQTQTNNKITPLQIDILSDFTSNSWSFLTNVKKILFGVDDWNILDNVMDVVEEFQYDVNIGPKQVQKIEQEN